MDKTRRFVWNVAAILFIAALAVIVFLRANPPRRIGSPIESARKFTFGRFVEGPLNVEAGKTLDFRFDLNRRASLVGSFATQNVKRNIRCLLVNEENYQRLLNGEEPAKLLDTNYVPGGKVDRTVDPGTYYLIFDNRTGQDAVNVPFADFSLDQP